MSAFFKRDSFIHVSGFHFLQKIQNFNIYEPYLYILT